MSRSAAARALRLGLLGASAVLLAACVSAPRRAASPAASNPAAPTVLPPQSPDVGQIPDAIPRLEPRSASGNPPFYEVAGHRYVVLNSANGYVERGVASWYGTQFNGLKTATGEPYDMFAMTAAHKTLPLPCYARVTNLSNGRSIVVRINDRGPFVNNRIIDLSYTAAAKLDMIRNGTAFVQLEVLTPAAPGTSVAIPVVTPAASAAATTVSNVPAVSGTLPDSEPMPAPSPTAAPTVPASPVAPSTAVPAPSVAPAPVTAAPSSTFYIQVGAYGQAENARRSAQKLRAAGIANVLTLSADARNPLERVRVGPIASVQQFDQLIAQLNRLGFPGARLAQD